MQVMRKTRRVLTPALAQEIWQRGLSPISDSNKSKWVSFLLEEDISGEADNSDEPPAVLADFDSNKLYDTDKNFYARYEDTLPEGWNYERITIKDIVEILEPILADQDKVRLSTSPEQNHS